MVGHRHGGPGYGNHATVIIIDIWVTAHAKNTISAVLFWPTFAQMAQKLHWMDIFFQKRDGVFKSELRNKI